MSVRCDNPFALASAANPVVGRFISADTLVPQPGSSQAYDRFAYVNNNPINFNDPSGHCISGAVADTIFCVFVGAMVVGAIYGGVSSGIEQNKETGHVNVDQVIGDTLGGAVIAGAPFIALIAAPEVSATAGYGAWSAGQAINSSGLTTTGIKAFTASNALTGFFTSPLLNKGTIYCRYCSNAELNAVKETGFLRGGREGKTYFTTDNYSTVAEAEERLALPYSPEVKVSFTIRNTPSIVGPTIVDKKYGHLGFGLEYSSYDPIKVAIRNIETLR